MTQPDQAMTHEELETANGLIIENVKLRAEVERLRGIEQFTAEASRHERDGLRAEVERLRELGHTRTSEWDELRAEVERLALENWQLKGALGYPVPGDIPQGPFKCGLCEAREPKP